MWCLRSFFLQFTRCNICTPKISGYAILPRYLKEKGALYFISTVDGGKLCVSLFEKTAHKNQINKLLGFSMISKEMYT